MAFTPVPHVRINGRSPSPPKTNGRLSPKGRSVGFPLTAKQRNEEMKEVVRKLLTLKDHEINSFSPEEKKEYEDFLRDVLKSWQDHRIREIVTPRKSSKMRRRRNKTRKN